MTYLQIVNNVLRRLREDEVTSVNDSDYSKLVGDFVNDAKRVVVDAWDWSGQRKVIELDTVSGTREYVLPGTNSSVNIFSVLNTETRAYMNYKPQVWMEKAYYQGNPSPGSPSSYTYDGLEEGGEVALLVHPEPDAVYPLRIRASVQEQDFSGDSDVTKIPAMPILHLALAMLARERGETGGQNVREYFAVAEKFLGDAIARDANRHPEELIWKYI